MRYHCKLLAFFQSTSHNSLDTLSNKFSDFMRKALALISGGLDSMLAAKLIMEQGIQVEGINFFTGFTGDCPPKSIIFNKKACEKNHYNATWIANQLRIKLHVINIVDKFKAVMFNPKYGFGANHNPCLDCKLFMIAEAKKWLEENNFDFLISGEVLGQRPMSQRVDTLPLAVKLTDDLIVRPLSAKLLQPTLPEREGWINRELLEKINGRGRKEQIALAARFGFEDFPQPAGGCLLTDPNFCARLKQLWQVRHSNNYSLADIQLIKIGRHLKFSDNILLIIGRDEHENNYLEKYAATNILLQTISHPGALVLVVGLPNDAEIKKIAQIAVAYSKNKEAKVTEVLVRKPAGEEIVMTGCGPSCNDLS